MGDARRRAWPRRPARCRSARPRPPGPGSPASVTASAIASFRRTAPMGRSMSAAISSARTRWLAWNSAMRTTNRSEAVGRVGVGQGGPHVVEQDCARGHDDRFDERLLGREVAAHGPDAHPGAAGDVLDPGPCRPPRANSAPAAASTRSRFRTGVRPHRAGLGLAGLLTTGTSLPYRGAEHRFHLYPSPCISGS